jgi:hypothetical protein
MSNVKKIMMLMTVLLVFITLPTVVMAEGDFQFDMAFTASWFPLSFMDGDFGDFNKDLSLDYDVGVNNYGLSATMGLKAFEKYGAYMDLKIDDPTFQKAVDVLGLLNIHWVFLKFDYHSFAGNVSWNNDTPNPIPGGKKDFKSNWTTFSLMAELARAFDIIDYWGDLSSGDFIFAVGAFYGTVNIPIEYRIKYPNHGYGELDTQVFGASFILSAYDYLLFSNALDEKKGATGLYFFANALLGWGEFSYDKNVISAMEIANNLTEGTIKRDKGTIMVFRLDGILAVTKSWNLGKGIAGFSIGVNLLIDLILPDNKNDTNSSEKDEDGEYTNHYISSGIQMYNFGPTARFHLRF